MKIFDQQRGETNIKTLRYEREVVNFEDVVNSEKIERLEIAFCNLTDISGITYLSGLRQISIYYCRFLRDISHIGDLHRLEDIVLFSLPKLEVNFSVAKLPKLERISYTTVSGITTIHGIEELTQLIYLGLSKVKVLDGDYSPIIRSKSLERVFWFGSPFQSPALQELRKLRPDIVIGGNAYNDVYWAKKRIPNPPLDASLSKA
jgi:hypothetical protein